jgi:hypothetical protein
VKSYVMKVTDLFTSSIRNKPATHSYRSQYQVYPCFYLESTNSDRTLIAQYCHKPGKERLITGFFIENKYRI